MDTNLPATQEQILKLAETMAAQMDGATLYENSVQEESGLICFMIRRGVELSLVVLQGEAADAAGFEGERVTVAGTACLVCPLTHENAEVVRSFFDYTNPVLVGKVNSYGFGDRLGNAGAAHLKALGSYAFRPVLAQQSIRELTRTRRTANDVLDAATWAVLREGYRDGFGADGDHLKTTDDIDVMVRAGYTMFTIDPSDHVRNEVTELDDAALQTACDDLPWDQLEETAESMIERLVSLEVELADGYRLSPTRREVLQGLVKYGRVIAHTARMADYLRETYPDHPVELELSVDETDEPTTLFEHYLIASELHRLGVELVSLAPRFCGDFEKGVDFRGDLDQFRREYLQHLAIASLFGGYKLSIHSGSDKFSVYEVIGSLNRGAVHVKTAGTSYLEALRTVAEVDPAFFREIMRFSLSRFEEARKTYYISADPDSVPDLSALSAEELQALLDDDDARQVLHVAYGDVLSGEQPEAADFKPRLMELLESNEALHEANLIRHFERHLAPFA